MRFSFKHPTFKQAVSINQMGADQFGNRNLFKLGKGVFTGAELMKGRNRSIKLRVD